MFYYNNYRSFFFDSSTIFNDILKLFPDIISSHSVIDRRVSIKDLYVNTFLFACRKCFEETNIKFTNRGSDMHPIKSKKPSEKFWMVYITGKSAPSYIHHSQVSAINEAERLAEIHKAPVYVLETVNVARAVRVETMEIA